MSYSAEDSPLRIGVLGTARISSLAIIQPAHRLGARLVAVAAGTGIEPLPGQRRTEWSGSSTAISR